MRFSAAAVLERWFSQGPVLADGRQRSSDGFASAAGHDVEFACQHTIQAACAPVAHGVSNER